MKVCAHEIGPSLITKEQMAPLALDCGEEVPNYLIVVEEFSFPAQKIDMKMWLQVRICFYLQDRFFGESRLCEFGLYENTVERQIDLGFVSLRADLSHTRLYPEFRVNGFELQQIPNSLPLSDFRVTKDAHQER
ncbi:MAG TPA: hypothetical protein PK648_11870, partial [Verrucomicrobiales bacterium]|nr:hypothetical protein [Verrucomicrobiales bacterium]